jgi:hypothetical protein
MSSLWICHILALSPAMDGRKVNSCLIWTKAYFSPDFNFLSWNIRVWYRWFQHPLAVYNLHPNSNFAQSYLQLCFLFIYFLQFWGLNSGPTPQATPPIFFYEGFFRDRVSRTVCLGWLLTVILLVSASWVARIIGVSHWCLAKLCF